MSTLLFRSIPILLLHSSVALAAEETPPAVPDIGATIAVTLDTGHEVVGAVDAATDEARLWLFRELEGVQLSSGFAWQRVRGWREAEASQQPADGTVEAAEAIQPGESVAIPAARIAAIEINAAVANWDNDPEPDGLRVCLRPIDDLGQTTPVSGQVSFQLMGQHPPERGNSALPSRDRFVMLGSWARSVRSKSVGTAGAVYQLEFGQFHPDSDFSVASEALLHARLGVPSVGVFEASQTHVYLHPFSRLRHDLQHFTGRRYFSQEHAQVSPRAR